MIASRNERAVEDPRFPAIGGRRSIERCQSRRQRSDDAMDRRLRELGHGGELADRQVRAQRGARDQYASAKRAGPRPAAAGAPSASLVGSARRAAATKARRGYAG